MRACATSFPKGTSAGPSGFQAAYLVEALTCRSAEQGEVTLDALTRFVNIVVAGKVDEACQSSFCGARLIALVKKDGGVRPVAVGEIFRRLAGKCLAHDLSPSAAAFLQPYQLGISTRNGCEAAVHALQAVLSDERVPLEEKWVVQIDLQNAFNTLDRTATLETTRARLPSLSPFAEWVYGAPSRLLYNGHVIMSTRGTQQGCPIGGILFAIGISPMVDELQAQAGPAALAPPQSDESLTEPGATPEPLPASPNLAAVVPARAAPRQASTLQALHARTSPGFCCICGIMTMAPFAAALLASRRLLVC